MKDYEVLRHLRETHGLTKVDLSTALEVSYPSYNRYENGERKLPLKVLINAAKYFNVPITYFNEELSTVGIGNKGYVIKNTETSETMEVTDEEFKMLKGVLESYRNK